MRAVCGRGACRRGPPGHGGRGDGREVAVAQLGEAHKFITVSVTRIALNEILDMSVVVFPFRYRGEAQEIQCPILEGRRVRIEDPNLVLGRDEPDRSTPEPGAVQTRERGLTRQQHTYPGGKTEHLVE